MNQTDLINRLNNATSYVEIFPDLKNWKDTYKSFSKMLHPDLCKLSGSTDAFQKLSQFKDAIEKGKKHKDDAGEVIYKPFSIVTTGEKSLLKKSYDNWKVLMSYNDSSAVHFKKYIPETGRFLSDNELEFTFYDRCIPLVDLGTLPQEHVNWIFSRILEFSSWLNKIGYVHCGFNPEALYVIPENHGLVITSFYHLTPYRTKLTTVSAKFRNFYPAKVFDKKIATPNIDVELAKRVAVYLLGDKSGIGTKLRKTHHAGFLDFVQKNVETENTFEIFESYRDFLSKNFEKKFHILKA